MKKFILGLLVAFVAVFTFATVNVKADDDLIDLYPNEDINQLRGTYGNSNWVLEFGDYRYHTVSFMARFLENFVTDLEAEEVTMTLPKPTANAMGGFINNNTDVDVTLFEGDRTNITGVINRIWAHFDEEGNLVMFEDHISAYYMTEVAGTNYFRLSTQAEIDLFEAAEEGEKPAHIRNTHMRMVLDDEAEAGYKIEPLGYLKWTNAEYVAPTDEVEESGVKSVLLDYDPNGVLLLPGHTSIHFSTWDRGKANIMNFVKTLPGLLISQEEKMNLRYFNPAPYFTGLEGLDVNENDPALNIVFAYGQEPNINLLLQKTVGATTFKVEARHVNKAQSLSKEYSNVDFKIEVLDAEGVEVLETILVEWDEVTETYTPEKELLTSIDTADFGAKYIVRYSAVSPEQPETTSPVTDDTVIKEAIIDVGVLPIRIHGIEDKFINEGMHIDPLAGLTADNNGQDGTKDLVDITDSLTYEIDREYNIWNGKAGTYQVTVTASYLFVQEAGEGAPAVFKAGEDSFTFPSNMVNPTTILIHSWASPARDGLVAANKESFEAQVQSMIDGGDLWQFSAVVLDGNDEVVAFYKVGGTKLDYGSTSEVEITAAQTKATRSLWAQSLEFKTGYKLVAVANTDNSPALGRIITTAKAGEVMDLTGTGFETIVEGTRTFTINVGDTTAPVVTVKAQTFTIDTDNTFADAEEAVLSNITVIEENGYSIAIPGIQRVNITTPGEHDINIVVTDTGGNTVEVDFKLVVRDARASETELDDKSTELGEANDKIADLENQITDLEGQIGDFQEALDAKKEGTSIVVTIVVAVVAAGLAFGGAFLLGRKTP